MGKGRTPILLSYPRSGNSWIRYILEYITGKPTRGSGNDRDVDHIKPMCQIGKGLGHVSMAEPDLVRKAHKIEENDPRKAPMILVLRNYKEVLVRHKYYANKTVPARHDLHMYTKILTDYVAWPGNKMHVYYEDIIGDDKFEFIQKITDFLEIDPILLDKLKNNYDKVKEMSISTYKSSLGKPESFTKGNAVDFHSSRLSDAVKHEWDNFFRDSHPELIPLVRRYFEENG